MIMRTFNILGEERDHNEKCNKKQFDGNVVKEIFRIEYFLDFMRNFSEAAAKAKVGLGPEIVESLKQSIEEKGRKVGSKELEQLCNEVQGEVNRKMVQCKGELAGSYKPTAHMDGQVFLSEVFDDKSIACKIPNNLKE